jgi:hypothetical protein
MTVEQLVELHERIWAEATGLTLAQVEERCDAAERAAVLPSSTDEQYETYNEWYGICYVMQPENGGLTWPGMDVYDPAKDGRQL